MIVTWLGEIQPSVLKRIENECQDKSFENSISGIFRQSSLRCYEQNAGSGTQMFLKVFRKVE